MCFIGFHYKNQNAPFGFDNCIELWFFAFVVKNKFSAQTANYMFESTLMKFAFCVFHPKFWHNNISESHLANCCQRVCVVHFFAPKDYFRLRYLSIEIKAKNNCLAISSCAVIMMIIIIELNIC